ncbi:MAG: polyphosphate kinase 1 [bacterium]
MPKSNTNLFEPKEAFFSRELSWLGFARRVLALVEDPELPLLERVRFAGIVGMLHDEFFMKRMSGLKRLIKKGKEKLSIDGRLPTEEYKVCRKEIHKQIGILSKALRKEIRPALADAGIPILDYSFLNKKQKAFIQEYYHDSVHPILTPLAVDAEHPFPFISNQSINIAVQIPANSKHSTVRFVRVKVPNNRPRWVPLPDDSGFVPLEQVIAANLQQLFPKAANIECYYFRVTRGADGEESNIDLEDDQAADSQFAPGSIVYQVTNELKARRFAGVVRLQVDKRMPKRLQDWLARQFDIVDSEIYPLEYFIGLSDLMSFRANNRLELSYPVHEPVTHPQLQNLSGNNNGAIFRKMQEGDILLHHPYYHFDTSVLFFIQSAAVDPQVLAIKLTIYRTSSDSPIVQALIEAVRRGKQVAVLVEITARFDEAPNIAWGQWLEKEGVHVSYGVERLKTHVKLALVVREEGGTIRHYLHAGTGNYHTGTARIYEDMGLLTCDPDLCKDAAHVFNELTGATPYDSYRKMLVAPHNMRDRFVELIRREAEHAKAGRPCGIRAKMNQLQDPEIIRELYMASQAGVQISLNIRGLCCLRPGVPDLSENIRVYSVVGRFLEHSRVYGFENGGAPEYFIGSADWMKRNLDRRVETIAPVADETIKKQLATIFEVYDDDNNSAWDGQPDGSYVRRRPKDGEEPRSAQEIFIRLAQDKLLLKEISQNGKKGLKTEEQMEQAEHSA